MCICVCVYICLHRHVYVEASDWCWIPSSNALYFITFYIYFFSFYLCLVFFVCVCVTDFMWRLEDNFQVLAVFHFVEAESLLLFLLLPRILNATWSCTACLHLPSHHRSDKATDAHCYIQLFTWVLGATLRLSTWMASHLYGPSIFKKVFFIEPGSHLLD